MEYILNSIECHSALKMHRPRSREWWTERCKSLIGKHCLIYFDDIIIFGTTIQEHNKNLAIVLERLLQTGLKLQPDKCEILKPELEYLGHLVTANEIKPNPNKLRAVTSFPTPRNPTQIKSFLGLTGYYRKFIRNFSKIAQPLTDLTKKNVTFNWKTRIRFPNVKRKTLWSICLTIPRFFQRIHTHYRCLERRHRSNPIPRKSPLLLYF